MRKRRSKDADSAPTLEDVARKAGVSVATVSRAISAPEVVREATRQRVAAAIEQTGYTPHFAARALALNRTRTVGAVIPTLNNAIFARGVNAFEEALRERGYTLLLSVSNYDPDSELNNILRMIERGVDGLMLVGVDHHEETVTRLRKANRPFVCTWSSAPTSDLPTIGFDNQKPMAHLVEHLVSLGHTKIAMIAGITSGNDRARERVRGTKEAMLKHGLKLHKKWLQEVRYSVDAAAECAARLLGLRSRPTAIICGNDVIAYGALFAADAGGLRVPQDVSIVGFDDLPLSARIPPGLTTVRVPTSRMGELAAHRLADIVEAVPGANATGTVELPTELVIRGSTGSPSSN